MRKGIFATNAQNVIAHNNNRSNSYVQTVNEFTAMVYFTFDWEVFF